MLKIMLYYFALVAHCFVSRNIGDKLLEQRICITISVILYIDIPLTFITESSGDGQGAAQRFLCGLSTEF